jgi:hypothetical protein
MGFRLFHAGFSSHLSPIFIASKEVQMAHVFISYTREDSDFAQILITQLKEAGITHWRDSDNIRAGDDWRQAIDVAIRESFALVVIMSPAAKQAEYVTYEWAFAFGLGIRVITLIYKETELHSRLEGWQYLDFRDPQKHHWDDLLEELKLLESEYSPLIPTKTELDPGTRKLIEALSSERAEKRRKAIEALGNMREQRAVLPLSERLLYDESWAARRLAVEALVQIGDRTVIPSLITAFHLDNSVSVRAAAARALGVFQSLEAVEPLTYALEVYGYNERDIKIAAASALGKIGDKSIAPRLLEMLRHAEINVAARIIETLGYFEETSAVEQIATYLNDSTTVYIGGESRPLNQIAVEALERIGTPEALETVKKWQSLGTLISTMSGALETLDALARQKRLKS